MVVVVVLVFFNDKSVHLFPLLFCVRHTCVLRCECTKLDVSLRYNLIWCNAVEQVFFSAWSWMDSYETLSVYFHLDTSNPDSSVVLFQVQ